MLKIGLNLRRNLIDMIKYLKINVLMLTVGNLMIWQVLINVLMLIIRLLSVENQILRRMKPKYIMIYNMFVFL